MANDYTKAIAHSDAYEQNTLTWNELYEAQFAFNLPFQLELKTGGVLLAEKIVRVVPKRRMVVFGVWQGKPVVAKLFFDPGHAKRHHEKDAAGVKLLQSHHILTPKIYHQDVSVDQCIDVILYERIFAAKCLEDRWRAKQSVEAMMPSMIAVIHVIAAQHSSGVMQHDLHLKNFILDEKNIYTLDGAQVESVGQPLSKKMSMKNLSLFLSQLGVGVLTQQIELFRHYAKARGWVTNEKDENNLRFLINHWNEHRWKRFEKKIYRECSHFSRFSDWDTVCMFDRRYASSELMHFMINPDCAFDHPTSKILKDGRSSTVVQVTLDNRRFTVKRYNMKSFWHWLRRCLRPTRASKSWRMAQKLKLFFVATATPVAFIDWRYFGLRGQSYYITEFVSGEHAGEYFQRHQDQEEKTSAMVQNIVALLKNLAKLDMTHGDLKMTNILIDNHEKPVLIDLDGAREHLNASSLQSAWREEIKRFLKNFDDMPKVKAMFVKELMKDQRSEYARIEERELI